MLSEGLADVVIDEADPATWPGAGKTAAELTQEERGNRYWSKKNAAATMTLLVKVMSITGMLNRTGGEAPTVDPAQELDAEVQQAEQQAMALLERANKGGHVH
ncbi:hypothetical protein HX782_13025 [Pseudomonas gingeri]|nr:hypothetical protein [Pseudomonas gingeri]NWA03715.1 hypothetical protein [Pseudomonas gingeri]NWA14574.1 hypothetical protein [Pseudomonas gingeri]NWA54808.1 hypothetical protein [Pseudomonas gingeri]NWA94532.1 hypothetical protein [Pseudomonas gingeri]NWB01188.1 hypothetical protein [Pseudomonas gingeri]